MKIIDLFAGVGGLTLGFEDAGFESVASVDLWSDAIDTFNHNRETKTGLNIDIREFNKQKLPKILSNNLISGVIGGPPCQGFSSARLSDRSERMNGINEDRNQLYIEFFKTVKIAQPDFFVLENVRGMLNLSNGAFVKDILSRFGKLGYEISYQLLNAADYGVPQTRHRVFFVGLRNTKFVFDENCLPMVTSKEALSDLPLLPAKGITSYASKPNNAYQRKMRDKSPGVLNHEETKHSQQTVEIISLIPDGGSIKSLPDEYWKVRKFNKAFQRMASNRPSLTIDTGHRNYFHFSENRVPTVRESARLQSFPDWFEFTSSKTSQYKQVGNAVPPALAFHLATQIFKQLKKSN